MRRSPIKWIAIVLDVVLLLGLAAAFRHVRQQSARERRELTALSRETETEAARRRSAGNGELDALALRVAEALPGLVCWGDAAMAGGSAASLPQALEDRLDQELLEGVRAAYRPYTTQSAYSGLKIPVANQGVIKEPIAQIAVRAGALPMYLAEPLEIPANRTYAPIALRDGSGAELRFHGQPYVRFRLVTVCGVEGQFYGTDSRDDTAMAFARERFGEAVTAPEGSEVAFQGAELYRDYVPVLFFGPSLEGDAEELVQLQRQILDRYTGELDCGVLLCMTEAGSPLDRAMASAFGDRYLRIEQAAPEDMTAADYDELAEQVYRLLDGQGCFDAVRRAVDEALGSAEALAGQAAAEGGA